MSKKKIYPIFKGPNFYVPETLTEQEFLTCRKYGLNICCGTCEFFEDSSKVGGEVESTMGNLQDLSRQGQKRVYCTLKGNENKEISWSDLCKIGYTMKESQQEKLDKLLKRK